MKPDTSIRQAAAYAPTLTVVERALQKAKEEEQGGELRTLLLKSAVLRDFDAKLLSRLAGRKKEDRKLLDDIKLFLPVREIHEDKFSYDEIIRQALLAVASEEEEQVLTQASQDAAAYFEDLAQHTQDEAEKAHCEEQALYYRTLADPEAGFAAWQKAWQALPEGPYELDRKAELMRQAEYAWTDLSDVSGAEAKVLVEKGWLAYNTDDWQGAEHSFHRALEVGGKHDSVSKGKANLGLGYAYYRQGTLGLAAQHFQKATRLINRRLVTQKEATLIRARALCGWGEVYTEMGAPEGILLRRRLLPEKQRGRTLLEYELAPGPPPLEDLALDRLLRKAEQLFQDALKTVPDDAPWAAGDRLGIQARQARLYLEQGDWLSARHLLEQVRRDELERLKVENERSSAVAKEPGVANRLAWINLYLGDCCLLGAAARSVSDDELALKTSDFLQRQRARLRGRGDLLQRVAKRRETQPDLQVEELTTQTAHLEAREHYGTALDLWTKMNRLERQALSWRRQADAAALDLDDPKRSQEALDVYIRSLDVFERTGNTVEVARAQQRIELLATRDEGLRAAVEDALAHRRRYFRYRVARKIERRLRLMHRVIAALAGLAITGVLYGWVVWLAGARLSQLSARVTGLPWALPVLSVCWIVGLMILTVDKVTFIRRWAVGMIPLRKFWLDQDQVAIDDIGLHLYDDTGQRIESIDWWDVWQVRSLTWQEKERKGGRVAVFGQGGQVIRFDHHLRGYQRLLESIRRYIEITGDADRWQERERAHLVGGFLVWSFLVLNLAVFLACPLALILALIPPITRFGKVAFAALAVIVACYGLAIAGLYFRDWLFVQALRRPRRTVQREVGPEKVWK